MHKSAICIPIYDRAVVRRLIDQDKTGYFHYVLIDDHSNDVQVRASLEGLRAGNVDVILTSRPSSFWLYTIKDGLKWAAENIRFSDVTIIVNDDVDVSLDTLKAIESSVRLTGCQVSVPSFWKRKNVTLFGYDKWGRAVTERGMSGRNVEKIKRKVHGLPGFCLGFPSTVIQGIRTLRVPEDCRHYYSDGVFSAWLRAKGCYPLLASGILIVDDNDKEKFASFSLRRLLSDFRSPYHLKSFVYFLKAVGSPYFMRGVLGARLVASAVFYRARHW